MLKPNYIEAKNILGLRELSQNLFLGAEKVDQCEIFEDCKYRFSRNDDMCFQIEKYINKLNLSYQKNIKVLANFGFEILGVGDDAIVIGHPHDSWAIRVGRNPDLYARFVKLSNKCGNIHFPIFISNDWNSDISITVVERLEKPDNSDNDFWVKANVACSILHNKADQRPFDKSTETEIEASLLEAVDLISSYSVKNNWAIDSNINNILKRKNSGDIVFTDIWSYWGD